MSSLQHAIANNDLDQVAAHLDAGADIEEIEETMWCSVSPLMCAAQDGHVEVAALLLDRGAQIDATNEHGETAFHFACQGGHVEMAELLRSRGCNLQHKELSGDNGFLIALRFSSVMIPWLVRHGVRADVVGRDHATVLHAATQRKDLPDLAPLLELPGVQLLVDVQTRYAWTALHIAASQGRVVHVRQLLDVGASAAIRDNDGMTPLHRASANPHVEVMRELLMRGANASAVDNKKQTALMRVVAAGAEARVRVQAVKLLLEYGADRSVKDNEGATARDHAASLPQVVEVLDTYFPIRKMMEQVLLGMRGPEDSSLTRLAAHELYEPRVLSLVKCLLTGEVNKAFDELLEGGV